MFNSDPLSIVQEGEIGTESVGKCKLHTTHSQLILNINNEYTSKCESGVGWGCSTIALCNSGAQEVVPCVGWGCYQSIGSTVSDSIVRSWLWSPHWATSVNHCKQLIIEPTFCGSRFSTMSLLAIEDSTFFLFLPPEAHKLLSTTPTTVINYLQ